MPIHGWVVSECVIYARGSRFSYHNLDYCLAAAAYEKRFGRSLWTALAEDFHLHDHGLEWLDRRDTPVAYNFMHAGLTSPDAGFVQRLDWQAARAPMGLTGNAGGLARFIHAHRAHLALAQRLRDDAISCDAAQTMACYDGFLNRVEVDGQRLWQQGGYLYGMAALFVLDEAGNFIVWLGAGGRAAFDGCTAADPAGTFGKRGEALSRAVSVGISYIKYSLFHSFCKENKNKSILNL